MGPALHLSARQIPGLLLVLLPIFVSLAQVGLTGTACLLVSIFLLRTTIVFSSFRRPKKFILESVAVSPYVEYVRWTLDYLQEPYEEVESVGILGALLVGRSVPVLHVYPYGTAISNSADIVAYLRGKYIDQPRAAFLQSPGKVQNELESDIWRFASNARKWIYYYCLVEGGPNRDETLLKVWGLYQPNIPYWQKAILFALLPFFCRFVVTVLGINHGSKEKALIDIYRVFDVIDERLAHGNNYILGTDSPTYVDILWASMAATILRPVEFSGGKIVPRSMAHVSDLPDPARQVLHTLNERPAAKHVFRLYKDMRFPSS